MPQNTPEARGPESRNSQDYVPTAMGYVKKPDAAAKERIQAVDQRVASLNKSVKDARFPIERKADDFMLHVVIPKIEEQANYLKDLLLKEAGRAILDPVAAAALNYVLTEFDKDTGIHIKEKIKEKPTPEVLDALKAIGRANRGNVDNPVDKAKFDELANLVIEMQQKLDAQQAAASASTPNIIINNNLAPQAGPQAPVAAVEKKAELKGWQEKGRGLIYQVASVNQRIQLLKLEHDEAVRNGTWDANAEKSFKDEAEALIGQRKQLLRTINSVIENARKPSEDRNQIAATEEETVEAMNDWLNDMGQNRRGVTIFNGMFKVI